jgi:dolichol kinase
MKPKTKINCETIRKVLHLLFGIFIITTIYALGTQTSFRIMWMLLLAGVMVGLAIKRGANMPITKKILCLAEREHEQYFPGHALILFFLSAHILLYFFMDSPAIVLGAMSVQVFADTASAIVGKIFGKHYLIKNMKSLDSPQIKHKTLEGSLAFFVVALICLSFFFPLEKIIVPAIVATLIELLPINDNLTVPISTAIAIKLLL